MAAAFPPISRWSASVAAGDGKLFFIVNLVLKAAPLATFGAISFTVGKYGLVSVGPLLKLIGVLYLASILFVLIVMA